MNPLVLTTNSEEALRRLDLKPSAGKGASELFEQASQKFLHGVDEWVEFDAADKLDEAEGFTISNFPISPAILAGCQNPLSVNRIDAGQLQDLEIKSIIGHNENADAPEIYFQNFDSGKIILPNTGKWWAFWENADESTFEELTRPVILLNSNLAALWRDDTLYFKSFFWASRIFDLTSYYQAATDEQLKEFGSHSHFSGGSSKVLENCSTWSRKHIALILNSGDLDKFTIAQFKKAAKDSDYELPVENGKIKLPKGKKELKDLLDFLCENFYSGSFSKRRYRSKGKRKR